MKTKKIICIIILLSIMMVLSACGFWGKSDFVEDNITIYKITKEDFLSFIQEPADEIFYQESIEKYDYSEDGDSFLTADLKNYKIEQDLIDFVSNKTEIEFVLQQNDFCTDITNIIVFDSPVSPITVWVKTIVQDVFITIDEGMGYKLYNHSDFSDKFNVKEASFLVSGTKVNKGTSVKLYYNHAEIPLITTFEALGASVKQTNNSDVVISFNGQTYNLNVRAHTFCKSNEQNNNLLHQVYGGRTFVYSEKNELIVDDVTLSTVLNRIGENVFVECDIQNNIVRIEERQG